MTHQAEPSGIEDLLEPHDLEELQTLGISLEEIAWQYQTLRNPPPSVRLGRAATIGDGIVKLDRQDEDRLDSLGALAAERGNVTRFVPASGAASRMFADLAAALDDPHQLRHGNAAKFFERFDEFPFAPELREVCGLQGAPESDSTRTRVIAALLRRSGLGMGSMPKGLVPFHRYPTGARTPAGEHVREAALQVADRNGIVRMHFTVPDAARGDFELELAMEAASAAITLEAGLSVQDPSTDTIAVYEDGSIVRDASGKILWRPGGHGSLLHNLELVGTPFVSIKNVDNVRREEDHAEVARWKRILIGVLDETRTRLAELSWTSDAAMARALDFVGSTFGRRPRQGEDGRAFLERSLQRPVRVCGVVRNDGEPGGAPFWVADAGAGESLQIVESSQVGEDHAQREIFESASHFNPVDIAACLVDLEGRKLELSRFVDRGAVFVASKWFEGREILALERPGLWNGAMAGWNTVCVEVPSFTFAPVKTVFDLLRKEHATR